jgi:hypothetical protein
MNDGHMNSTASLGINTHFSASSASSSGGSPLNSPLISPANVAGSPSFGQESGHWDQLQNQFSQQMSLQPPSPVAPVPTKPGSGNTFVHKLYK